MIFGENLLFGWFDEMTVQRRAVSVHMLKGEEVEPPRMLKRGKEEERLLFQCREDEDEGPSWQSVTKTRCSSNTEKRNTRVVHGRIEMKRRSGSLSVC